MLQSVALSDFLLVRHNPYFSINQELKAKFEMALKKVQASESKIFAFFLLKEMLGNEFAREKIRLGTYFRGKFEGVLFF